MFMYLFTNVYIYINMYVNIFTIKQYLYLVKSPQKVGMGVYGMLKTARHQRHGWSSLLFLWLTSEITSHLF